MRGQRCGVLFRGRPCVNLDGGGGPCRVWAVRAVVGLAGWAAAVRLWPVAPATMARGAARGQLAVQ